MSCSLPISDDIFFMALEADFASLATLIIASRRAFISWPFMDRACISMASPIDFIMSLMAAICLDFMPIISPDIIIPPPVMPPPPIIPPLSVSCACADALESGSNAQNRMLAVTAIAILMASPCAARTRLGFPLR